MGRKKASAHGFAPGIFVRLPMLENYRVRRLVRKGRPLGKVMRELVLAGLEVETAHRDADRAKLHAEVIGDMNSQVAGEVERLRDSVAEEQVRELDQRPEQQPPGE